MYLFHFFHSFLPLRNTIGFGAADFVVLSIAILSVAFIVLKAALTPYLMKLAERPPWAMLSLFTLAILLRLALLRRSPAPIPSGADDFSYVLLGDTLSHLRLANPPHPLSQFFESVFVLQHPAYASIYPLGQGLLLALTQLTLHSQWAGILLSSGVFCALVYWMLRAWVPPIYALIGGLLAIMQFGPLNPWVNSYWGGFLSASAGCLVFGSLPRLRASPRIFPGGMLGLGLALQMLTRPFESIFLLLAAAVYLLFAWRKRFPLQRRPALAALSFIFLALGLTLFQNRAVTNTWTTLPYMLSRYQYGVPTTFTFQPNPTPHRPLTQEQQLDYDAQAAIHGPGTDTPSEYLFRLLGRFRYLRFFFLPPLYFALLALWPDVRNPRIAFAAGTVLLFALGTNFYPYFFPHYIAAVTCLFLLFSVRGLQRLGHSASLYISLVCTVSFAFWFSVYLIGDDVQAITDFQSWNYINPPDPQGRESVQKVLSDTPGKQLVFVRYSPAHRFEEWVHNSADIDSSKTVWANDLGPEENQALLKYFPDRKPWLLEPDSHPLALSPYPVDSGAFITVH